MNINKRVKESEKNRENDKEKHLPFKERLERNLVWFSLTIIIIGFIAGFGVGIKYSEAVQKNPPCPPVIEPKLNLKDFLLSKNGPGIYEMQWAGENWKGFVTFTPKTEDELWTNLKINKLVVTKDENGNIIDRYTFQKPVLITDDQNPGIIKLGQDSFWIEGIKVKIFLFKPGYPGKDYVARSPNFIECEISSAENIKRINAFAGRVYYTRLDDKSKSTGDFLIFQYPSSL